MSTGGLSLAEIMKIVNRYIGVTGGYLGDFSYRTHADFYPEYCDLEIDPHRYEGTTLSSPGTRVSTRIRSASNALPSDIQPGSRRVV